jgi:hypothetical protein
MGILLRWGSRGQQWVRRAPVLALLFGESLEEAPEKVVVGGAGLLLVGLVAGALNRGLAGALVGGLSGAMLGTLAGALASRMIPRKAGKVSLGIELSRDESQYHAGDVIEGYVRIISDASARVRSIKAYLSCRGVFVYDRTPGARKDSRDLARRTKDYVVQETKVVAAVSVARGSSTRHPFRFVLPADAIPSHQGYACSIEWSLHANLELQDAPSVQARQDILVSAPPHSAISPDDNYQAVRASDDCQLALTLDRRVCAEGDTIQGTMRVTALEPLDVQEVRALLLRVEHNPEGENHFVYISQWDTRTGQFEGETVPGGTGSTYVWLEDEVDLSGPAHLDVNEAKSYPFGANIPLAWRPSFGTAEGSVAWQVVAIVTREAGDLRVSQDVIVYTGAPLLARVMSARRPQPSAERAG